MKLDSIDYKKIIAWPDLLAQIISIDAGSDTCFQEMDQLIRSDQGMALFVLRVANSAMYNCGKPIKTIPHAINLLGINIIRSLAVLSVSRVIFTKNKNTLFQRHVWQHSLLTALACQQICLEMEESKLAEEAFVAGLLHDIGKVLLHYNYPDDYPGVLGYVLEHSCSCAEAERKFLEINHNDVGKRAIVEWKLPAYFVDYTGTDLESLHRSQTENKIMLFLVIANSVIKNAGFGARMLTLTARREKLMCLGADAALCNFLLDDAFLQKLLHSDIYLHGF
ncbi:MAG: HDOD domain-containing protein [Nitrosomonas sp.]|nr:HDOD domain-containing protein [Nitrosomonas sp.]